MRHADGFALSLQNREINNRIGPMSKLHRPRIKWCYCSSCECLLLLNSYYLSAPCTDKLISFSRRICSNYSKIFNRIGSTAFAINAPHQAQGRSCPSDGRSNDPSADVGRQGRAEEGQVRVAGSKSKPILVNLLLPLWTVYVKYHIFVYINLTEEGIFSY